MQLMIDGISVEVLKKEIKHLHLYVLPPDGRVRMTAPRRLSQRQIEEFVRSRADWIQRHRARFAGLPAEPAAFETGETLFVWGRPFRLLVEQGTKSGVTLWGDTALLRVRAGADAAQRKKVVREWQRSLLREAIAQRLPVWERRTGLFCSGWQIRFMKTRWGTCNTATKKLWFNLQLAQMPEACLDYILLHELAHLKVANHGPAFEAVLDEFMPNWRERRERLNGAP